MVSSTHRPQFAPGKDAVPILQEVQLAIGTVWTAQTVVTRSTDWAKTHVIYSVKLISAGIENCTLAATLEKSECRETRQDRLNVYIIVYKLINIMLKRHVLIYIYMEPICVDGKGTLNSWILFQNKSPPVAQFIPIYTNLYQFIAISHSISQLLSTWWRKLKHYAAADMMINTTRSFGMCRDYSWILLLLTVVQLVVWQLYSWWSDSCTVCGLTVVQLVVWQLYSWCWQLYSWWSDSCTVGADSCTVGGLTVVQLVVWQLYSWWSDSCTVGGLTVVQLVLTVVQLVVWHLYSWWSDSCTVCGLTVAQLVVWQLFICGLTVVQLVVWQLYSWCWQLYSWWSDSCTVGGLTVVQLVVWQLYSLWSDSCTVGGLTVVQLMVW